MLSLLLFLLVVISLKDMNVVVLATLAFEFYQIIWSYLRTCSAMQGLEPV